MTQLELKNALNDAFDTFCDGPSQQSAVVYMDFLVKCKDEGHLHQRSLDAALNQMCAILRDEGRLQ